jgi:putative HD superfamily hydrolase of NAD metabolism
MVFNEEQAYRMLANTIDAKRYIHSINVMHTAISLAMRYEYSLEEAKIAGLLHDCAKCFSNNQQITLCKDAQISISEYEKEYPDMLHAKLGAYLARKEYGIEKKEILDAITFHITGRSDMGVLEKIVFVADYIEPSRKNAPNLEHIRKLAFVDIDRAIYLILKDTIAYVMKEKGSMDMASLATYEFYENIQKRTIL